MRASERRDRGRECECEFHLLSVAADGASRRHTVRVMRRHTRAGVLAQIEALGLELLEVRRERP